MNGRGGHTTEAPPSSTDFQQEKRRRTKLKDFKNEKRGSLCETITSECQIGNGASNSSSYFYSDINPIRFPSHLILPHPYFSNTTKNDEILSPFLSPDCSHNLEIPSQLLPSRSGEFKHTPNASGSQDGHQGNIIRSQLVQHNEKGQRVAFQTLQDQQETQGGRMQHPPPKPTEQGQRVEESWRNNGQGMHPPPPPPQDEQTNNSLQAERGNVQVDTHFPYLTTAATSRHHAAAPKDLVGFHRSVKMEQRYTLPQIREQQIGQVTSESHPPPPTREQMSDSARLHNPKVRPNSIVHGRLEPHPAMAATLQPNLQNQPNESQHFIQFQLHNGQYYPISTYHPNEPQNANGIHPLNHLQHFSQVQHPHHRQHHNEIQQAHKNYTPNQSKQAFEGQQHLSQVGHVNEAEMYQGIIRQNVYEGVERNVLQSPSRLALILNNGHEMADAWENNMQAVNGYFSPNQIPPERVGSVTVGDDGRRFLIAENRELGIHPLRYPVGVTDFHPAIRNDWTSIAAAIGLQIPAPAHLQIVLMKNSEISGLICRAERREGSEAPEVVAPPPTPASNMVGVPVPRTPTPYPLPLGRTEPKALLPHHFVHHLNRDRRNCEGCKQKRRSKKKKECLGRNLSLKKENRNNNERRSRKGKTDNESVGNSQGTAEYQLKSVYTSQSNVDDQSSTPAVAVGTPTNSFISSRQSEYAANSYSRYPQKFQGNNEGRSEIDVQDSGNDGRSQNQCECEKCLVVAGIPRATSVFIKQEELPDQEIHQNSPHSLSVATNYSSKVDHNSCENQEAVNMAILWGSATEKMVKLVECDSTCDLNDEFQKMNPVQTHPEPHSSGTFGQYQDINGYAISQVEMNGGQSFSTSSTNAGENWRNRHASNEHNKYEGNWNEAQTLVLPGNPFAFRIPEDVETVARIHHPSGQNTHGNADTGCDGEMVINKHRE